MDAKLNKHGYPTLDTLMPKMTKKIPYQTYK